MKSKRHKLPLAGTLQHWSRNNAPSEFESLEGLTGVKRRRAWARNKVRKLRALGLNIRLKPRKYRHWPELDGLHGKARKLRHMQLYRADLITRGFTGRGKPRKRKERKWPQLAGLNTRSTEYGTRYMRLKRSLAADSRLGVMVRAFERGGTLSGRLTK